MNIDLTKESAFEALGFSIEEKVDFCEKLLKATGPNAILVDAEEFIPTLTEKELLWFGLTSVGKVLREIAQAKGKGQTKNFIN